MAILPILKYPDPRLREETKTVEVFDDALRILVRDMAETMYDAPGVGLAAPQIGASVKLFVIDCAGEDEPSAFRAYINPEIVEVEGSCDWEEGCLSFPGGSEKIRRAAKVRVKAHDEFGKEFELEASGLLAVAIQHENDHLNGVLMIDKLGTMKRRRFANQVRDELARSGEA